MNTLAQLNQRRGEILNELREYVAYTRLTNRTSFTTSEQAAIGMLLEEYETIRREIIWLYDWLEEKSNAPAPPQ